MPYGSGWDIVESEEFLKDVEEHIGSDEDLEWMLEDFLWLLRGDPVDVPLRRHLTGSFWYSVLIGPPPFLVFFTVEDDDKRITLEILTPSP